jgi:hypothetical protein
MSEKKATSAGTALIYAVIGIAMMVGGMWLYKNWHPEFLKSLEEQGILLNPGKTVAVIGVFLILFATQLTRATATWSEPSRRPRTCAQR